MPAPFYLVWCEGTHSVTKKHSSQHEAHKEARRLANARPGENFYVVQAIERFRKTDIEHERFDTSEVPF